MPRFGTHESSATFESGRKPLLQFASSRPEQNAFCGLGLHSSGLSRTTQPDLGPDVHGRRTPRPLE